MNSVIRPARPEDGPACARILSDWIDETDWMPRLYSREQDAAFVAGLISRGSVWVVESGDLGGFMDLNGDRVECLYLAPQSRRQGIGARLLQHAKSLCPGGLGLWTFAANEGAIRFYQREGLQEKTRTDGDNDEGLPDVEMRWPGRHKE